MHRERVIDALWPDVDVDDAAPRLHKAAHYARRSLGEADRSSSRRDGRAVPRRPGGRRRAGVPAVGRGGPGRGGSARRRTRRRRVRRDLLPQDLYESWTEAPRDRLRLQYLRVLRLAERWEALVAADPGDEQAHLALIRRLAASRRPARRDAPVRAAGTGLRRELGVAPSAAALRLRDELLAVDGAARSAVRSRCLSSAGTASGPHRRLLDSARQGRGRVLFVAGAAASARPRCSPASRPTRARRRMRVGKGTAAMIEGDWPYAPVLEALADLCRHHPTLLDGLDDTFRDEIERALSGRQFSWDGQGAHQRLFVAAAELLRLAAAGAGAVLVIDDAHDADDASLRLLHYLARSTITERLLIAVGHRPVAGRGARRRPSQPSRAPQRRRARPGPAAAC